jgi:hypothetical protein
MLFKEFHIRPVTNQDIPSIKKVVFSSLEEYALQPEEDGKDSDLQDIERNYFSNNGFFGVAVNINPKAASVSSLVRMSVISIL